MTSNRSLDEFADASSGEAEPDDDSDGAVAEEATAGGADEPAAQPAEPVEDAADEAVQDARDSDPDDESDDVPPAASTYAWSPDGGPCAACGENVEERWREGEDLVCAGCKDW